MGAAPVETKTDDGVIDWGAREVRVIGVGTPRIVSNTGALTEKDLYQAARLDAERRLRSVLARIPIGNGTTLGELPKLAPILHRTVLQMKAGEARHFADGTIHIPASASFGWVSKSLGSEPEGSSPRDETAPTGLVLELTSRVEPTIRALLVSAAGLTVSVGTSVDPVGAEGISWVYSKDEALAHPLAGVRPLVLPAAIGSSGPGQIFRLNVEAAPVFAPAGLAGGIVVVLPPPNETP